jgi:hypothetical protein
MNNSRRNDLDALRAFAMLLGIGLHAALAYTPSPWAVQDTQRSEAFGLFFVVVHGFRMPLFFLISGFFTAMLWRQKGLKSLLWHRFQRVLVPCLLGTITVLPLMTWIAAQMTPQPQAAAAAFPVASDKPSTSLIDAIRKNDSDQVELFSTDAVNVQKPDPQFFVQPLAWAAMLGHEKMVVLLLDREADIAAKNGDGSTALHGAAFTGRPSIVKLLLDRGADPLAKSNDGTVPFQTTFADAGTTDFIFGLLQLPTRESAELADSRKVCRELLPAPTPASTSLLETIRKQYTDWMTSDRWLVQLPGMKSPFHLLFTPVFDHLWFLWFLGWLVGFFAVIVQAGSLFTRRPTAGSDMTALPDASPKNSPGLVFLRRLVVSPLRFLWLIPVTLLPQLLMGLFSPSFGPDTSVGLIPQPHILFYYSIFFGFGILYFEARDEECRHGRHWWITLPLALLILLPIIMSGWMSAVMSGSVLLVTSALLQVCYAWLMSAGCMGFFHQFLQTPRSWIRYMSDSSYWLYIAHMPLLFWIQGSTRTAPVSPFIKFFAVCTVATLLLLLSYETLVRYTWIGAILNGRKYRSGSARSVRPPSPGGKL